jgi:hypothetical protein
MKQSQLQFVINQLKLNGFVSRNFCLKERITRLGARINDLKKLGWDFRTEFIKENGGLNYYYFCTKSPLHKVIYTRPDGSTISILK